MAFHFQPRLRRFADHQPDFIGGVAPWLAIDTDLDHARADERILAHGFHDFVGRIGFQIFRIDDLPVERHLGIRRELSAHATDDQAGRNQRRAGHPPLLDRAPQRDVGVAPVVSHVAHDREAGRQHLDAVRHRLNRAQWGVVENRRQIVVVPLRHFLVREREVVVRIHQARNDCQCRQVDHGGAGRNCDIRTDRREVAVLHQDDLVGGNRTRRRIDEATGLDGGDRRRRSRTLRRERRCGEGHTTDGDECAKHHDTWIGRRIARLITAPA